MSSPRIPPMILFAFIQLACVYLLHTAVTSTTSLVWKGFLLFIFVSYELQKVKFSKEILPLPLF